MKNEYYVYMHTFPDGKKYVGITNQEPEKRWLNGRGYKHNPAFFNSILLHGWLNIKHEVLFTGLTKEEASNKEKELIKQYRSDEIEHGFNCQSGGDKGFTHNAETRKRISETSKQRWQDSEYRQKIHQSMIEAQARPDIRKRKSEYSKNRYHNDTEYREKFIASARSRMNKPEIKERYREMSKKRWQSPEYREQMRSRMSGENNPCAKAVEQYSLDGRFIKRYSTCKEAAEATGTIRSGITACAKGHQKNAGGFVWRYTDAK